MRKRLFVILMLLSLAPTYATGGIVSECTLRCTDGGTDDYKALRDGTQGPLDRG